MPAQVSRIDQSLTLIISGQRYAIDDSYPFRVIQAQSFRQFMQSLKPAKPKEEQRPKPKTASQLKYSGGIKINLGVK
ncbi:hypothetical protein [Parageobacillus thermoglucosidasius]|uniref:hypothetical protein n=1 Tax=Parageobacillus thermoglucosidasius TaxID=1426 RepID=UPI0004430184|nr:hypothetical protein [Parageobacillus thermoglucosidasius]GAJ45304.1 hypothetical protein GT2_32_00340 [Parageobacillus thermoglucosidasius NBRC 107763]